MIPHTIFTFSQKDVVIAQRFLTLFNQENLKVSTSQDLDSSYTNLDDKLSIFYHINTHILLISKHIKQKEEIYWEHIKQKHLNESNVNVVPIILEEYSSFHLPSNIEPLYFKNNYQECVNNTKKILSTQQSTFDEIKVDLAILLPMLFNDIQMLSIA